MDFVVTYKGIRCYCGKLMGAYRFVEQKWGSRDVAWQMGVKLQLADLPRQH